MKEYLNYLSCNQYLQIELLDNDIQQQHSIFEASLFPQATVGLYKLEGFGISTHITIQIFHDKVTRDIVMLQTSTVVYMFCCLKFVSCCG